MIEKPQKGTYPEYFDRYIQLVSDDTNVLTFLENQSDSFVKLLNSTVKQIDDSTYQENKWTPKEVLGHLVDAERVLSF
ncbi:MAG: DinB family protein, partial [Bacteroidota bacterium]